MEAFGNKKSDPRGMPEMCRIEIAKPIDSLIFLPGAFSEQKIGSERSARNVSDFHCETYRFVNFPTVWVSRRFSKPKNGSERYARNVFDFHCKTDRLIDFPSVWASGTVSEPKIKSEGDARCQTRADVLTKLRGSLRRERRS